MRRTEEDNEENMNEEHNNEVQPEKDQNVSIAHTGECPCATGVEDPVHILQNCPTHIPERIRLWLCGADLYDKQGGSTAQTRTTAQFTMNINSPI